MLKDWSITKETLVKSYINLIGIKASTCARDPKKYYETDREEQNLNIKFFMKFN